MPLAPFGIGASESAATPTRLLSRYALPPPPTIPLRRLALMTELATDRVSESVTTTPHRFGAAVWPLGS